MKYEQIVFAQGEDANEPLKILDEQGTHAAIEYLLQWDNGDSADIRDQPSAGTRDTVVRIAGLILTFNTGIGYIGLEREIKE